MIGTRPQRRLNEFIEGDSVGCRLKLMNPFIDEILARGGTK